jgi:hypothetical protein
VHGDDHLVHEAPLGAAGDQLVGLREKLDQAGAVALLDDVEKRFDREDVVEVHQQLVVAVGQHQEARQHAAPAPLLDGRPAGGALHLGHAFDLVARHPPGGAGEHELAVGDARQEGGAFQRPPAPTDAAQELLVLQGAEKAIDPEAAHREVVGAGEARHDLSVEAARAQHDAVALHGHQQVGHRDLMLFIGAGASKERDLVIPQHRAREDVADAPLRQVHDLGENGLRAQRLLGPQMLPGALAEQLVGMAEAAQEAGAGGARGAAHQDLELAAVERLGGCGGEGNQHLEGVGQALPRRGGRRRHLVEVFGGQLDLVGALRACLLDLGEQHGLARSPRVGGIARGR